MHDKQHSILLVDDEAHITEVLARRLRKVGFEVFVARNVDDAFKLFQQHLPNMIITDLQMPGKSGLQLTQLVRTHPAGSKVPILLLTARGYLANDDSTEGLGLTQILQKPFSARKLTELAFSLLEVPGSPATSQ